MQKKKSEPKARIVIARILAVLISVIALFMLGVRLYFRIPVQSYYKASDKAFAIPGLSSGMVPQGLDFVESEDLYLVGGYQNDGSPSRIYLVDRSSGKENGYVILADENGNGISPHAGGLAVKDDYLFVAGDEDPFMYVFSMQDVLSSGNGGYIKTLGKFNTVFGTEEIRADFICAAEDKLIVGEFYRDPDYLTPDSHTSHNPSGDESHAVALCFRYGQGDSSCFGLEKQPFEAYALPKLTQGIAVHEGLIWTSESYALDFSTVKRFDIRNVEPFSVLPVTGGTIPLYALDSSTFSGSIKLPPMAEEIIFVDGKMLTMCESASLKYIFGNLIGGRWCYETDVSDVTFGN